MFENPISMIQIWKQNLVWNPYTADIGFVKVVVCCINYDKLVKLPHIFGYILQMFGLNIRLRGIEECHLYLQMYLLFMTDFYGGKLKTIVKNFFIHAILCRSVPDIQSIPLLLHLA